MKEELFTIGEISKICGINQSKLRYYDEIGVIKPYKVDEHSGYRYYTNETLQDIPVLHYFQNLGFPLKKIPALLEREDLHDLEDFFAERLFEIEGELRVRRMMRDSIVSWQELLVEARAVLSGKSCPITLKYLPPLECYTARPELFQGMRYGNLLINTTICAGLLSGSAYTLGALYIAYPDGGREHWEDVRLYIARHPEAGNHGETAPFGDFSAVSCYHRGDFDNIDATVAKMKDWAEDHCFTLRGDLIERSVIDCWSIKNRDCWLMELFLPVIEKK